MTILLAALAAFVFVLFAGVLATYLVLIDRRLRVISTYLGKVAFGVRAVETQTNPIGPSVLRINARLRDIDAALGSVAEKAKQAAGRR